MLQVDVIVTVAVVVVVAMTVKMTMIMAEIVGIHSYFRAEGWVKERDCILLPTGSGELRELGLLSGWSL
jgi:hypothetical protein